MSSPALGGKVDRSETRRHVFEYHITYVTKSKQRRIILNFKPQADVKCGHIPELFKLKVNDCFQLAVIRLANQNFSKRHTTDAQKF